MLEDGKKYIFEDPFIASYMEDLLRSIRLNILLHKVKPYRTVSLEYLGKELKLNKKDIQSLLAELILEQRLHGQIDQIKGFLELESEKQQRGGDSKHQAMLNWARSMQVLHQGLAQRLRAS